MLAGLAAVGLVAIASAARLGEMVSETWADFPADLGIRGGLVVLALVGAGAAALVGVRRLPGTWLPWAPLLLLVAVRALLIPLVPTPMPADDDPRFLHELAIGVLDGGNPLVAHRPMGFSTMLAGLYAFFGPHPWLGELLNLVLAVLAGAMLHRLVLPAGGPTAAATAVTLYAIAPSQVLLATTLYTETAYAAVLLAAMALAAAALRGGRVALAVGAGAVLALSQYVRPLSQAFLIAFLAAPILSSLRPLRALVLGGVMAVTFLVVLAPIAVHNATVNDALSLSTSSYGGWSVFVGANGEHDGRFNEDDQAILRSMSGSVWERSEILGRAGIDRITGDPRAFAGLAVRKFQVLWADDTFAVEVAFLGSEVPAFVREAVRFASQTFYAALAVAAGVALWRLRRATPPEAVLLAGTIVIVAAAHTFLEVQPRYHAYAVPLLCALAALATRPVGARREGLADGLSRSDAQAAPPEQALDVAADRDEKVPPRDAGHAGVDQRLGDGRDRVRDR